MSPSLRLLGATSAGGQTLRLVTALVCSLCVTSAVAGPMAYQAVQYRQDQESAQNPTGDATGTGEDVEDLGGGPSPLGRTVSGDTATVTAQPETSTVTPPPATSPPTTTPPVATPPGTVAASPSTGPTQPEARTPEARAPSSPTTAAPPVAAPETSAVPDGSTTTDASPPSSTAPSPAPTPATTSPATTTNPFDAFNPRDACADMAHELTTREGTNCPPGG